MFARIVRDYPLGGRADDAKTRLQDLEFPVPQPDPKAVARMKYEQENYKRRSLYARATSVVRNSPDVSHAAKEGSPTMTDPKRTIPASIPVPVNTDASAGGSGGATGTTEVSASTGPVTGALDAKADARQSGDAAQPVKPATASPNGPLPTNRDKELAAMVKARQKKQAQLDKKAAALEKKARKKKPANDTQSAPQNAAAPSVPPQTAGQTTPASSAVPAGQPGAGQAPPQQ
jgi:outer membrane protein assembly factor BamD